MRQVLSQYQKKITQKYLSSRGNILVEATAGSGKTFTITHLISLSRAGCLCLAFNKSIAETLTQKVSRLHKVSTIHSLGYKGIRDTYGHVPIKENKVMDILLKKFSRNWVDSDGNKITGKKMFIFALIVKDLIDAYRIYDCHDEQSLLYAGSKMDICFSTNHITETLTAISYLTTLNKNPKSVDFLDMVYLAAKDKKIHLPNPHTTFIDEVQDLSIIQQVFVQKVVGKKRVVMFGDRNQSIYAFGGADSSAFDNLANIFNPLRLPLRLSYRCSRAICEIANNIIPNSIEPLEDSDRGETGVELFAWEGAEDGDFILCRNLKPLVELYLQLLSSDKKSFIRGKDLGAGLLRMISKYSGQSMKQAEMGLDQILKDSQEALIERGITNPLKHPSFIALDEKVQILIYLSSSFKMVDDVVRKLKSMFKDDDGEGIVLSTIHKSKGLEADNVYFYKRDLIPSKFATTTEQKLQETNLLFVGVTRAKNKLIFC